jgi:replication-associated recombination protein RarA
MYGGNDEDTFDGDDFDSIMKYILHKLNDKIKMGQGTLASEKEKHLIMLYGPPASGKTFYADLLSRHYNIPKVNVKQLIEKAFELAKIEEGGGELAEEIKAKVEELRDAMVA